jgi:hypothetical protein
MRKTQTKVVRASDALIDPTVLPGTPVIEVPSSDSAHCQQIAERAYSYWQARGCPDGSPEEDWYRAENDFRRSPAVTDE